LASLGTKKNATALPVKPLVRRRYPYRRRSLNRVMTKTVINWPRITLSRRGLLGLASGATAFSFWQRKAHTFSAAERYSDRVAAERIADRDAARPPILVDAQTHVWWRAGGIRQMSERGEHSLIVSERSLAAR
jgi:hypothetical protein